MPLSNMVCLSFTEKYTGNACKRGLFPAQEQNKWFHDGSAVEQTCICVFHLKNSISNLELAERKLNMIQ